MKFVLLFLAFTSCAVVQTQSPVDVGDVAKEHCVADELDPPEYYPEKLAGRAVRAHTYEAIQQANKKCTAELATAALQNAEIAGANQSKVNSGFLQGFWIGGGGVALIWILSLL